MYTMEANSYADNLTTCIGCGAAVPRIEGPTHPYIGASPGCWLTYTNVLEQEYGPLACPSAHRLTVDAYAAQHPGVPSPAAIRSVATHLIGLYVVLETGLNAQLATMALRYALRRRDAFHWLDPPRCLGDVTILDVVGTWNLDDHERVVRDWARSVWAAWSPHHATVKRWARDV